MTINKVKKYVLDLCETSDIRWKYHISSAVKYANILSKKFGANQEVVVLSAWLHDIASIKHGSKDHHIRGAQMAEKLLLEAKCDEKIVKEVVVCILSHMDDKKYIRASLEQKIVASADGMSDFDYFDLTSYRFILRHSSLEKSREMILDKYERAYLKIMPEARDLIQEKYKAIKKLIMK